ncbi:Hypothetical predicted protein [Octopus vulgaris]|uniref:Uncharacterized protein n=1 Tax=Octopus vulgaris TaxID=6645 RepID=A0AA36FDY3_OCTVU|nr:Hypothetical predicted protein [Octopus vulgaris]
MVIQTNGSARGSKFLNFITDSYKSKHIRCYDVTHHSFSEIALNVFLVIHLQLYHCNDSLSEGGLFLRRHFIVNAYQLSFIHYIFREGVMLRDVTQLAVKH